MAGINPVQSLQSSSGLSRSTQAVLEGKPVRGEKVLISFIVSSPGARIGVATARGSLLCHESSLAVSRNSFHNAAKNTRSDRRKLAGRCRGTISWNRSGRREPILGALGGGDSRDRLRSFEGEGGEEGSWKVDSVGWGPDQSEELDRNQQRLEPESTSEIPFPQNRAPKRGSSRVESKELAEFGLGDPYLREQSVAAAPGKGNELVFESRTATEAGFYEEVFEEENKRGAKNPFIKYERDTGSDEIGRNSRERYPEPAASEIRARSLGPFVGERGGEEVQDGSEVDSRSGAVQGVLQFSRSNDQRQSDGRQLALETRRENPTPNSQEYLDPYAARREMKESLSFGSDLQRSNLDESRGGQQTNDLRSSERYPSIAMGGRLTDRENSASISKKPPSYNLYNRRGSPSDNNRMAQKVDKRWRSAVPDQNAGTDFRTSSRYEDSPGASDEDGKDVMGARQSFGRDKPRTSYGEEVLVRGSMYAKQVISRATARAVGYVTQLWVDLQSLKVVTLEMRANWLFGNLEGVLLKSIDKVGDVVLVDDEVFVLEEMDLFNCSELVGSDLLTENGFYLGKVRDFHFSLGDGAVLSLEFDSFGIPLIPSNLISTYSLTIDEVIEAQEDSLLVRKGAEKRIQKMTMGLFSRPMQPTVVGRKTGLKEKKKQAQPMSRSGTSYGQADGLRYTDRFMNDPGQNVRAGVGNGSRPSSGGQKSTRESTYLKDRRPEMSESAPAKRLERGPPQDPYYEGMSSTRVQDVAGADLPEDSRSSSREVQNTPEISDSRKRESRTDIVPPDVSLGRRGLPLSYRKKKSGEND